MGGYVTFWRAARVADGGIIPEILVVITGLSGGMFWRNNTGAGFIRGRWIEFGCVGSGDILGCYRGRGVAIECKSSTGRHRGKQRDFQAAWEAAGGLYILARSVDDVLLALGVSGG